MTTGNIGNQTSKGFFGTLYTVIKFIIEKWYLIIGIFALISVIVMSIKDSYQQNDIGMLVLGLGSNIMSPDSAILLEVNKLKENPSITVEGDRKFTSYWEKIKFKLGKYGSHLRILTSLLFLIGMFYLFYQGLNLISERKGINMLLSLLIMVLLEMSFMLMLLYKEKTQVYPSMSNFLSTYHQLIYLVSLTVIIFLTFAIFNMQESSQSMMNIFYTLILGTFIFIFIGYLGVVNTLEDKKITNVEIVKTIVPFKGVYNLISNYKVVIGLPVEKFIEKMADIEKTNLTNLNTNKSIII